LLVSTERGVADRIGPGTAHLRRVAVAGMKGVCLGRSNEERAVRVESWVIAIIIYLTGKS